MEERKEPTWFPNTKVYHNGSHFIAIPHTTNRRKKRLKPQEKVFVVSGEIDKETGEEAVKSASILSKTHRNKKTGQNTFFNKKFGRSDFEKIIKKPRAYLSAIEYILKYISKTGERIVYSRGLPMYRRVSVFRGGMDS